VSKIDAVSRGFIDRAPDPARYGGQTADPDESAGIVLSFVAPASRVLDVGCGIGSVSELLVKHKSVELIGLEPDADRAAMARQLNLNVINDFFTESVVRDLGMFDVVLFGDVLEHLVDPVAFMDLAKTVLKPGGVVIFSVPNVAHWTVRLSLLRGRFNYHAAGIMDATHLRWFTLKVCRDFCRRAGYEVLHHKVSAGSMMIEYQSTRPWRWMWMFPRERMVRRFARWWPTLFGLQHIIVARPKQC